jgi:pimeloyl-ACP methyl ester carboxylesterase
MRHGNRPSDEKNVLLASGRRMSYRDVGDATAIPVIALHGTPGSRLKFVLAEGTARRVGLRLISPDRWGYGNSDTPADPRLADYANDVEELTAALGIGSFAVLGVSGGGPFAAAVTASLGRRVSALALVSPVGPIARSCGWRELQAFHAFCFRVLPHFPGVLRVLFLAYRQLLMVAPQLAMRVTAARGPAADKTLLRDPVLAEDFKQTLLVGLANGVRGPIVDLRLFSKSWGFALDAITAPAQVWLGENDGNVPRAAARHLAASIPGSKLTKLPGRGHYWILRENEMVLRWLAEQARATASGRELPERPPAG